jgi:hypothetical protein
MAKKKKAKEPKRERTIPWGDPAFHLFQLNFMAILLKSMVKWGLDRKWIKGVVLPAQKEWNKAWGAYQDVHSRTIDITARKILARKAYEKLLRILVNIIRVLPTVSELEKSELGIVMAHSGSRKPHKIKEKPSLSFLLNTIRQIIVEFGAKPVDVHGLDLWVKVGGSKPEKIEDFHTQYFAPHTPHTLEFDENQRYSVVYIIACFVGTTGQKGPWSEIYTVVIP